MTTPKALDADIAVIYGTRPEVIKLSPLVVALRQTPDPTVVTISTHQHTSLLEDSLAASHLITDVETRRPDGSSIQHLVSSIGANLQDLGLSTRAVVVQGDTVTAYAGALFGFLNGMSVIHLEAGLRTSSLHNPFPEEGLRRAITRLADLHLAPTIGARNNLEVEGVDPNSIVVTGNTSIDALERQLRSPAKLLPPSVPSDKPLCVVTLHRRESWGAPIARVASAIGQLAGAFPGVRFVCPLHPNPIVRRAFDHAPRRANVVVMDPLPHDDFVNLLRSASMIITDSGGIQEESTVLGIPTLVTREETERPEAVQAGVAHLVGTDVDTIVRLGTEILRSSPPRSTFESARTTFGDGNAGIRCSQAIHSFLNGTALPDDMVDLTT